MPENNVPESRYMNERANQNRNMKIKDEHHNHIKSNDNKFTDPENVAV